LKATTYLHIHGSIEADLMLLACGNNSHGPEARSRNY